VSSEVTKTHRAGGVADRRRGESPGVGAPAPHGVNDEPPRGRAADVCRQLALWIVLGLAYEAVRGAAGHDREAAVRNGRALLRAEQHLRLLFEPRLQRVLEAAPWLAATVRVSYWASEFAVLVLALLWTYLRHRGTYARFRDAVLVTNGLGLVGYLLVPTAPPRVFSGLGFTNALSGQPPPRHATGLLAFAANPYAAMPSVHAADALLTGIFLASLTRRRAIRTLCVLWPVWVVFVVLASGNHFWLDVVAGGVVAAAGLAVGRLRFGLALWGSSRARTLACTVRRSRPGPSSGPVPSGYSTAEAAADGGARWAHAPRPSSGGRRAGHAGSSAMASPSSTASRSASPTGSSAKSRCSTTRRSATRCAASSSATTPCPRAGSTSTRNAAGSTCGESSTLQS